jgi:ABC-type sugar transport system ATPase subunit
VTSSNGGSSFTQDKPALLEMRAITKRFPGVLALSEVSFNVGQGEVVALIGENGAGKSTLMKIISGVYLADSGEIIYKGKPVTFTNPRQAQAAGIATIYQELNQVPQLSITENIFLGSEITRGPLLDWAEMYRQARQLLAKLRLDVDPRMILGKLGVGGQQMVEVAKALHHRAGLVGCPGCQHRVRGPRPTGSNLKPTTLERTKKAAMFKYYCPGQ